MTPEEFRNISNSIPTQPGIYKYFDADEKIIYIGKAKNLRKRVSSYFTKTLTSYKTHELVKRIIRIEFTIVDTEQDAFLLENTLIKEFQPRYNINLKDDKSYPYIVIKKEPFPRIFLTRQKINDGSEYLGPYTSSRKIQELLELARQTIRLRNCTLNLTEKNIRNGKFKVCLEYHLGNCKGPCEGYQTETEYLEELNQLKNILKGNMAPVIRHLKEEMKEYATELAFEKAEIIKKKIEFLENYQSRSLVVNAKTGDLDVFSILKDKNIAYVNFLMVRNGTIIQTHTSKVETSLEETLEEILSFSIARLRNTFNSDAKEFIVPFEIDFPQSDILIKVPKAGDRKKLLELSEKNVQYFIDEIKNKERLKLNIKSESNFDLLRLVQQKLQLPALPIHIECFDNSNFQGSYPVSAMVSFKNGIPSKKDYRHFNVKTIEGINDFGTMKEAVFRRYKRLKEEEQSFPQLVIIDGGKGQLSAAQEAINELGLQGKMTLVGLAKNIEEIFFTGDTESLKLPLNSPELKFIRSIRDEVHRFGITFHRKKRSKGTFKNELETINGIGESTVNLLLKEFKSIKKVKEASQDDLEKVVGKSKAKMIIHYFAQ
ncbi:MAG: excinuclease ABC subunit C [Bacteroidetes bacterium]|nr:excinuclease ABC subunit C [Bacteroidota bacterium]